MGITPEQQLAEVILGLRQAPHKRGGRIPQTSLEAMRAVLGEDDPIYRALDTADFHQRFLAAVKSGGTIPFR